MKKTPSRKTSAAAILRGRRRKLMYAFDSTLQASFYL